MFTIRFQSALVGYLAAAAFFGFDRPLRALERAECSAAIELRIGDVTYRVPRAALDAVTGGSVGAGGGAIVASGMGMAFGLDPLGRAGAFRDAAGATGAVRVLSVERDACGQLARVELADPDGALRRALDGPSAEKWFLFWLVIIIIVIVTDDGDDSTDDTPPALAGGKGSGSIGTGGQAGPAPLARL